jgi:hypothetical protein
LDNAFEIAFAAEEVSMASPEHAAAVTAAKSKD